MRSPPYLSLDEPAGTVFWFGLYLGAVAVLLFAVPGFFLSLFFLPPPVDPWVRVLAVPLFNFALMYLAMARWAPPAVLRMTAITRSWVIALFGALVALHLAPPMILIFAVVDLAGAIWTLWAIRRQQAPASLRA